VRLCLRMNGQPAATCTGACDGCPRSSRLRSRRSSCTCRPMRLCLQMAEPPQILASLGLRPFEFGGAYGESGRMSHRPALASLRLRPVHYWTAAVKKSREGLGKPRENSIIQLWTVLNYCTCDSSTVVPLPEEPSPGCAGTRILVSLGTSVLVDMTRFW
jgi:hypothetical protein